MLVWLGLVAVWVWPRYWALVASVLTLVALQAWVHWGVVNGLTWAGLWPRDVADPAWSHWAWRTAKLAGQIALLGVPLVALRKAVERGAYKAPPKS